MRFNPLAKKCAMFLFFVLAFSSLVYAQDIEMQIYRDSYSKFETVQLEVTLVNGTFSSPLGVSNLNLRDSSGSLISIAKNSLKINETKYFYYFNVPDVPEGMYEISLSSVSYVKEGINYFSEFTTNLSVLTGNIDILSVRPGYVLSNVDAEEEASFSLIFVNRGINALNVVLNKEGDFFNFQQQSFSLNPGQTKNVGVITHLSSEEERNLDSKIRVNYAGKFYEIPFLVFRSGVISRDVTDINETSAEDIIDLSLIENPVLITTLSGRELENLTISLDVNEYYPPGQIVVKNNAGIDLRDVEYFISGDVGEILSINPLTSSIINVNESAVVLVSINDKRDFYNGDFSGSFDVRVGDSIIGSLPIFVNVYGVEAEEVNESADVVSDNKESVTTVIGPEEEKGFGLWIFLIFIIVLLFVLFYVYRKTKKKKEEFESYIDRIKR